MSDWILVPCLVALRNEFNRIAPGRDRKSDGSIGDTAHAAGGTSDHLPDEDFAALQGKDADTRNEVHAIDVDDDLTGGSVSYRAGATTYYGMEAVVQHLLARCRSGAETRLRYIIYNRRIWSASSGWVQKTYAGANPHNEHAHFSASYDTDREASTASWHLEDLVALTPADAKLVVDELLDTELDTPYDTVSPKRKVRDLIRYIASRDVTAGAVDARLAPKLAALATAVGADDSDEAAIVAGVLAGLDPAAIAAAIPADLAQRVADELAARLDA